MVLYVPDRQIARMAETPMRQSAFTLIFSPQGHRMNCGLRCLRLARVGVAAMLFPSALVPAQARDAVLAADLNVIVNRAVRQTHFGGVILVADDSRIRYSRQVGVANAAFGIANGPHTRFRIASVTKQFTAMLVMQLVQADSLRLDATIADYLPWFTLPAGKQITLEQLLTHMSGIRDLEEVQEYYASTDSTLRTHADVVRRYLMVPPSFAPGTNFRYNNGDYIILGAILEAVTHKSFQEMLQQRILTPLGMNASGLVQERSIVPMLAEGYDVDERGTRIKSPAPVERFLASGAMFSTVNDLLTWDRALLRHSLLSRDNTERMFRPNQWGGALGSWQYDWRPVVDSSSANASKPAPSTAVRVIERQGWIGVFRAINVMLPERGINIIIIANCGSTDLSTLSRGTGVASDVIAAVERATRPARKRSA
jgi:D-alanyl-D-alanine carboxypeptidase